MVAKRVQHIALKNMLRRNVAIVWPGLNCSFPLNDIKDVVLEGCVC